MAKQLSLYRDYIQKSRIFLYPALDLKRGHSVTPIQTYCAWKGKYSLDDKKFICLFHIRNDEEYKTYSRNKLMSNRLFHDYMETDDHKAIFVFDFSKYSKDWKLFLDGKYSKISPDLKEKIRSFFGTSNLGYIDSYLYPERYFNIYSEFLTTKKQDVPEMNKLLREVGELCSKPNLELEMLIANIKDLHVQKKNV